MVGTGRVERLVKTERREVRKDLVLEEKGVLVRISQAETARRLLIFL
jgi:hypothetical protein